MINSLRLRGTGRRLRLNRSIVDVTSEQVFGAVNKISTSRLSLISERQRALEKYPYLKEFVTITDTGVKVRTIKGDLEFGFKTRYEFGHFPLKSETSYGKRDLQDEYTGEKYSYDKLDILIMLFGQGIGPYKSILGLNPDSIISGNEIYPPMYWTTTSINNDFVHVFHLVDGNIFLGTAQKFPGKFPNAYSIARYFPF